MKGFKLIYFKDCPNAEPAKELVSNLKLKCEFITQDDLNDEDPLLSYTSPTLICNDQIIFGSKTDSGSRGCSLKLPSLNELKKIIQTII